MLRNSQREGQEVPEPREASLSSRASPRPSHYGPPHSLWEIIKYPLFVAALLLAEIDPVWSGPNLTGQPSSRCTLFSCHYKLLHHSHTFFSLFLLLFLSRMLSSCTQILTPLLQDPALMFFGLWEGSFPPGKLSLLGAACFYISDKSGTHFTMNIY